MARQRIGLGILHVPLVLALLAACGAGNQQVTGGGKIKGDREMISHAEGVEPLWIQECAAPSKENLPFCGEATRVTSRQAACTQAYADALGKLRRSIGQKVDVQLEPDGKGGFHFQIKSTESQPLTIRGVWEDQRWYEEYEGPSGRSYDCHVMITYPRLEYDLLMAKAHSAAQQRVDAAARLHAEGKSLATEGNHAAAIERFDRAKTLLNGLKERILADTGANSDLLLEQVLADLKASSATASETGKTAILVVRLNLDGQSQDSGQQLRRLQSLIQRWLSGGGLRIRPGGLTPAQVEAVFLGDSKAAAALAAEKGAGLLWLVEVESDFETEEDGIFYAYALGALRLLRTSDGRELFTAQLDRTKGGYPGNRNKAVAKAFDNLIKEQLKPAVHSSIIKLQED